LDKVVVIEACGLWFFDNATFIEECHWFPVQIENGPFWRMITFVLQQWW
jgi:hypothetical protein